MEADRAFSVLVVDDDPGMVTTLQDILGATGYRVDSAHSGAEALQQVDEHPPDCILLDIRMPGMDGVETFRELKRRTPESLVILMTAYANSTLVEEARHEGALRVVRKPIDLQRLIDLIAQNAKTSPAS